MPVKPPDDDGNLTEVKEQNSQGISSTTSGSAATLLNNADVSRKHGIRSEMVTSRSGDSLSKKTVKRDMFAIGSETGFVSDDVVLEKQAAKEQFLKQDHSKLHQDTNHSPDNTILDGGSQTETSSTSTLDSTTSSSFEKLSLSSFSSSPQPASDSHLSLEPSSTPLPTISAVEYPPEFKEHQYDCVLIHSTVEEDKRMAMNFKEIIEKYLMLEDQRPPRVCMLDNSLEYIESCFAKLDEAVERSTTMFFFMTKHFVSESWADFQKDECLMKSLTDPTRRWCVVPLHTKPKTELDFSYPFGLRALKGMDVWRMVKGTRLSDVDPHRVEMADLDKHFMTNIKSLFNQRLCHKLERERKQQAKLMLWISEEQTRRRLEAERHQQELRHLTDKNMNESTDKPQKAGVSTQEVLHGFQIVNVTISHCDNLQIGSNNTQNVNTAEVNENASSMSTEYEVIEEESISTLSCHDASDESTQSTYQSNCSTMERTEAKQV